jgi:hypothetical protein
MKSTDFFIDKANEYIKSIDNILQNFTSKYSGGFDKSPELKEQERKISDLQLKIRLLFSEFDKGDIFYSNLKYYYEDSMSRLYTTDEEILKKSKHTLELFIDHLKEFRS